MEYKIFYSWQSENATVTNFIKDQLIVSCNQLSDELNVKITVIDADSDQRGSYNINTAVISGIINSDIIIADLTPTSHGDDGRANPNSNSLYEYAFACATKGFENVIAVADVSNDNVKNMPFDWNHNALVTLKGTDDKKFGHLLKEAINKILKAHIKPVLCSATTTFFALRVSESFPGVRGLKEYTDQHEIKKHLDALFKHPIIFGEATDNEGDKQPIWWFRGGSADAIDSYRVLKNGVYLLGSNEFKIKRIIVFECHQRYYSEYVYIETEALPPIFDKTYTPERIQDVVKMLGYCDEEYGVVKSGGLEINITGEEFDDGHSEINGDIIDISEISERRCRFLSPYNFVVCAKFSSINCNEFDVASRSIFEGILNGTADFDQLHNLIKSLPKPPYRGR